MSHDTQLPDEFLDAAREAEEQIYQATPSRKAHEKKLRRELLQHARGERAGAQVFPFPVDQRGTTFAIITAAAAAAIAFVWCGSNLGAPPEVKESIVQPNALAKQHGLINTTPNCDATASPDGESIRIARECTWSWPAASAEFTPEDAPLQLAKAGDAMRIYKGKVRVEVDPERERTEPVRIDVGAGVIEVTGTAFTITQREDDRGEVFLHHGTIHFVFEDGDRVAVPKGTSLSWPRETAKLDPTPDKTAPDAEEVEVATKDEDTTTPPDERLEATSSKSKKVEKKRPPAKPKLTEEQKRERAELDTKQLLEIRHLRRLGEHDEALRKLAALEKQTHSSYTREVISYEMADIHISRSNTARACAQWKRHIKRFPKGRYAPSVRESMRREGCSE